MTQLTATIPDIELAQRILPEGEGVHLIAQGVLDAKAPYLDVRPYFRGEDGEWVPTTRGVRVPLDLDTRLFKAIRKSLEGVGISF